MVLLLAAAACGGRDDQPPAKPTTSAAQPIWDKVGSWSGSGSQSTDSFSSDTGALRIVWETRADPPGSEGGEFKLTIHSAISGRALMVAVDHKGPGKGTAVVGEDPRVFFAEVESNQLQWTFTIDERLQ